MTENQQHDDHIWLNVNGEAWAIHSMQWPYICLWRGYDPNLDYAFLEMSEFNAESYVRRALKLLYG